MDKKKLIICILAAVLIISFPISSVIGTNVLKSNNKEKFAESPLFKIRTKSENLVKSRFIGKGLNLNIFLLRKSSFQTYIDKSIKFIEKNPNMIKSIIEYMNKMPEINKLLQQAGLDINKYEEEINHIFDDKDLLNNKLSEVLSLNHVDNDPRPLGLSTSSALGCFIVALVVAPIFALIGAIIATFTIITCLNFNGCFENLVQGILDSFIQGLKPSDYKLFV